VACAGVTLNAVATALGLALRATVVRAEGDLDFRGTLGVAKDAAAGFREVRLTFDIDGDLTEEQRATLMRLTERYCVVYQTLRPAADLRWRAGSAESEPEIPLCVAKRRHRDGLAQAVRERRGCQPRRRAAVHRACRRYAEIGARYDGAGSPQCWHPGRAAGNFGHATRTLRRKSVPHAPPRPGAIHIEWKTP
jgi:hypothetical protein